MDGEKNITAKGESPLRPRGLGQLPTSWGAFCAGKAREKASSLCGEVTSAAKSEGLSPLGPHGAAKKSAVFLQKIAPQT